MQSPCPSSECVKLFLFCVHVRLRGFWIFVLHLLFGVVRPLARGVPKWPYISCGEAVPCDGSRILSCEGLQQPYSWGRRSLGVRSVEENRKGKARSLRVAGLRIIGAFVRSVEEKERRDALASSSRTWNRSWRRGFVRSDLCCRMKNQSINHLFKQNTKSKHGKNKTIKDVKCFGQRRAYASYTWPTTTNSKS